MTLAESFIDGYKATRKINGDTYRLQVWKPTKSEANKVASFVRQLHRENKARVVPSAYHSKKVYLVFSYRVK